MKHYYFFILGLSFSTLSHANFIIGNLAEPKGEEAVCRILYRNEAGALTSICSGTLVNSKKIITAAHCIDEAAPSVSVECGYLGIDGVTKIETTGGGSNVVTQGSKFKESRTDISPRKEKDVDESNPAQDIGVIELKTAITTIPPVHFSRTPKKDFFEDHSNIRADSECKIEGFGINNEGESGKLNSGPVSGNVNVGEASINAEDAFLMSAVATDQLEKIDICVEKYHEEMIPKNFIPLAKLFSANKVYDGAITHGDSGGPLLCRKRGAASWTIVGIASRSGFGKDDEKNALQSGSWHLFSEKDWEVMIEGKPRKKEHKIKLEDIDVMMEDSFPSDKPKKKKKPTGT